MSFRDCLVRRRTVTIQADPDGRSHLRGRQGHVKAVSQATDLLATVSEDRHGSSRVKTYFNLFNVVFKLISLSKNNKKDLLEQSELPSFSNSRYLRLNATFATLSNAGLAAKQDSK